MNMSKETLILPNCRNIKSKITHNNFSNKMTISAVLFKINPYCHTNKVLNKQLSRCRSAVSAPVVQVLTMERRLLKHSHTRRVALSRTSRLLERNWLRKYLLLAVSTTYFQRFFPFITLKMLYTFVMRIILVDLFIIKKNNYIHT